MPKPKGGRGNVAPYDTKLTRIPVPLADQVSQLVERYQGFIAEGGVPLNPPELLDLDKPVNKITDAEREEVIALRAEVEQMAQQITLLRTQLSAKPVNNLNQARDKFLANLKVGKQAPEYKRTKTILDRFLETLTW